MAGGWGDIFSKPMMTSLMNNPSWVSITKLFISVDKGQAHIKHNSCGKKVGIEKTFLCSKKLFTLGFLCCVLLRPIPRFTNGITIEIESTEDSACSITLCHGNLAFGR